MAHFIMNNNQTRINDTNLQNYLTHTRLTYDKTLYFCQSIVVENSFVQTVVKILKIYFR